MTFLVSRVGKLRPDWSECGLGGGAACDWSAPDHSDYNGLVTHNQYWRQGLVTRSQLWPGDYVLKRHHCQYPGGQ